MTRFRFVTLVILLAAAPLQGQTQPTTTVGGYGEFIFAKPSGGTASADVARVVVYLAHTFDERLAFRSELEVEHARLEAGGSAGEVAFEQAFLDYRLSDRFTLRSGLVLVPVGIINETHEPATFNGVVRPAADHDLIPATWREIGVGALGNFGGGWSWRAYLVNGLKAEGFSAAQGIREGRQEGQGASFAGVGVTGRLEWARPGLKLGLSGFHGGSADTNTAVGSGVFGAPVTILAADARWESGPWTARALLVNVAVPDAGKINAAFGGTVAERSRGGYVEGAFDLLHLLNPGSPSRLDLFTRIERVNTQATMPTGTAADRSLDRTIVTSGVTFRPLSTVAFKADYQLLRTDSGVGEGETFDLGLGFSF